MVISYIFNCLQIKEYVVNLYEYLNYKIFLIFFLGVKKGLVKKVMI